VCSSVLQCVAVYCNVLQYVALYPSKQCVNFDLYHSHWECVTVYCSVLQCVALYCSVLQCVALYCSVLQCVA